MRQGLSPDVPGITPLTPEQREKALDAIAERIHRYRLEVPTMLMLEASRPLAGLAGMASFVVTPLFGAFTGLDRAESYAALVGDRGAYDELIERLDKYREASRGQGDEPTSAGNESET